MSLLDRGPDVVQVQPYLLARDADGNPVLVGGAWVFVYCRVHPSTTDEVQALGDVSLTDRRITARYWPSDGNGVVWWDGRTWDIVGEPELSSGRRTTRHYRVRIRARAPKAVV